MSDQQFNISQDRSASQPLDVRLAMALERQQDAWHAGKLLTVDEAAASCDGSPDALLELIYNEIVLRENAGESPTLGEYQRRFPELAEALQIQWDIDRALCESPDESSSGARIGRYVIEAEVGRGSVGIVYRARDTVLNRVVALKRLRAGFDAGHEELDRFSAEAKAIARLPHPQIVQVFDVGIQAKQPYFAMEFCNGGSLAARLKGQPLAVYDAARLVGQLASGVAEAHSHHLVHRDLKPANVLLADETLDAPKISDFGLAKRMDGDSGMTATGALVGTPAYMAPEQAAGRIRDVGPEVDIYALGAILYECLTGRRPFDGTSMAETLEQVLHQEPLPPRQLRAGIAPDLETIALKCLQKEPKQRYQSAALLAEDLSRFLAGQPIVARPVSAPVRVWRWCRRNAKVAMLVGSIALLLTTVAIGSLVAAVWLRRERDIARTAQQSARASQQRHLHELYHAYLFEAQTARLTNSIGHRQQGLSAIRKILEAIPISELSQRQQEDLRDEAAACLSLADARKVRDLPPWCVSAYWFDADIDPSFTRLACVEMAHGATKLGRVSQASPDEHCPILPKSTYPWKIKQRFSPDGRWLVRLLSTPADQQPENLVLRVWSRDDQAWLAEHTLPFGCGTPELHPSRPEMILPGADGVLHTVDILTGKELRRSSRRFSYARVAFDPTGKLLAVNGLNQPAEIVNSETGDTVESLPEASHTSSVAWSAVDGQLFFGFHDGRMYVWNVSQRRGHFLPQRHAGAVVDICVSPDGSRVASSSEDAMVFIHKARTGEFLFSLPGRALRFSADSGRLAVERNGQISFLEPDDVEVVKSLRVPCEGVQFSPDGRWLATGGADGARVVAADDLSLLGQLHVDSSGPVGFSPSGRELVTFGIFSHLWKWPITAREGATPNWQIGPPRRVPLGARKPDSLSFIEPHHHGRSAVWSYDATLFAAADYRRGRVFMAAAGEELQEFGELMNVTNIAISSDKAWLAASTDIHPRVRVWSIPQRQLVLDRPLYGRAAFSDDGRWLAMATSAEVELYQTATWKLVRKLPQDGIDHAITPLSFQPQGNLLAYSPNQDKIVLYDVAQNRVVAKLNCPDCTSISSLNFSPDGTNLAFAGRGQTIGIWHLGKLRTQLESLGLKAEGLPDLQATVPSSSDKLLVAQGTELAPAEQWTRVWLQLAQWEVIQGRPEDAVNNASEALKALPTDALPQKSAKILAVRGHYHIRNQSPSAALGDWQQSLRLHADQPATARNLARLLLLGPVAHRDPQGALALLMPLTTPPSRDPEAEQLLGIAWARLGRWEAARDQLQRIGSDDPKVQLALAMTYQHLGDHQQAVTTLGAAMAKFTASKGNLRTHQREEIETLAREAGTVIGTSTPNLTSESAN